MNMKTELNRRSRAFLSISSISKKLDRVPLLRGIVRSQSGQSLVELALLTPILLLLVIGTVDMGRYAYISIQVGNAARAGAAYGAQSPIKAADTAGIKNAALNDGENISGLNVTSTFVCECDNGGAITSTACTSACTTGNEVTSVVVTASGSFSSLFNWPGIPSPLPLSSTAKLRVAE
jgi:Flp pilus assembly protein TadG